MNKKKKSTEFVDRRDRNALAHSLYLSIDQGVHANGEYQLDIIITASVAPLGGAIQINLSTTIHTNWTVTGH